MAESRGESGQDDPSLPSGSRRSHHNALERSRRSVLKKSYATLKRLVPTIQRKKVSRSAILREGASHIERQKALMERCKEVKKLNDERLFRILATMVQDVQDMGQMTDKTIPEIACSFLRKPDFSVTKDFYYDTPEGIAEKNRHLSVLTDPNISLKELRKIKHAPVTVSDPVEQARIDAIKKQRAEKVDQEMERYKNLIMSGEVDIREYFLDDPIVPNDNDQHNHDQQQQRQQQETAQSGMDDSEYSDSDEQQKQEIVDDQWQGMEEPSEDHEGASQGSYGDVYDSDEEYDESYEEDETMQDGVPHMSDPMQPSAADENLIECITEPYVENILSLDGEEDEIL